MSKKNIPAGAPATKQEGQMGKWAPYYDLTMALMTLGREKKLRQTTINLSRLKPGDKVLEIGCGTGTLTMAAKARVGPFGEAAGIDIAPEMVAVASRKAARKGVDISFREGSIAGIPYPDNHFDAVMCSFMIFHMPEEVREKGFTEIYRVLKPGGHLFILDTEPVDRLVPVLQKKSFAEVETGKIKFMFMGLLYLRAKVEKRA
jgi:ubiquinone/menaquinone biosynthesis C-methylase UbiE